MIVVPLHRHFSPSRLEDVVEKMRIMGSPRIRAYFDPPSRAWFSMEGTHRLRAALILRVPPTMVPTRWSRGQVALERARHAIRLRGHAFDALLIDARGELRCKVT